MENVSLKLGRSTEIADGTYYGVAKWDSKHRDYLDVPGLFATAAEAVAAASAVGSRVVRWTVSRGAVTTRRGLS